jgi:hypothetical protein
MGHAQRFDAVNAQKGTPLWWIVAHLKTLAEDVEAAYDANSPEVVSAMQYFEQGLGRLVFAPPRPGSEAPAETAKSEEDVPGGEEDVPAPRRGGKRSGGDTT